MKNLKITIGTLCLSSSLLLAQQNPTGLGQSGTGATSGTYWARGGNNTAQTTNNIFGTLWNSPVYHFTNGKK